MKVDATRPVFLILVFPFFTARSRGNYWSGSALLN